MSVRQFSTSLGIIRSSEHCKRTGAVAHNVYWQGRKLGFPRPLTLRLSQPTIMDDEPGSVISMVNMLGRYDFNNMHFVQMVLAKAPTFIDIGANIGPYTLIASELPAVRVVSVEPVPAAFAKLPLNIELNGRTRVTALNLAVSNRAGTVRIVANGASVYNRIATGEDSGAATIDVPSETLDDICRQVGIVPAMIKIDVEGHEPEVLAGATESLASCHACIVENGDRAGIVATMRRHGMTGPHYYRHRAAALQTSPQPLAEDQVFVSPRFIEDFPAIAIESR